MKKSDEKAIGTIRESTDTQPMTDESVEQITGGEGNDSHVYIRCVSCGRVLYTGRCQYCGATGEKRPFR